MHGQKGAQGPSTSDHAGTVQAAPEKQCIRVWHDGRGHYGFTGDAELGRLFKGLVVGKCFGVAKGNMRSLTFLEDDLRIPFSGTLTVIPYHARG
jgi:hypothetical protein